jgi:hypothetical protein
MRLHIHIIIIGQLHHNHRAALLLLAAYVHAARGPSLSLSAHELTTKRDLSFCCGCVMLL